MSHGTRICDRQPHTPVYVQRIIRKQSGKQFQFIIIAQPDTRIRLEGTLGPEHGVKVVCMRVSPVTSVLHQLCYDRTVPKRWDRTYFKRILLIGFHLLVRLQHNFPLIRVILASTVTARRQGGHHLTVARSMHEHLATRGALTSRQRANVQLPLTDETDLL